MIVQCLGTTKFAGTSEITIVSVVVFVVRLVEKQCLLKHKILWIFYYCSKFDQNITSWIKNLWWWRLNDIVDVLSKQEELPMRVNLLKVAWEFLKYGYNFVASVGLLIRFLRLWLLSSHNCHRKNDSRFKSKDRYLFWFFGSDKILSSMSLHTVGLESIFFLLFTNEPEH